MKVFLLRGIFTSLVLLTWILGCKDVGSDIPLTVPGVLAAGSDTVLSIPGDTSLVSLSGGTLPYSIVSGPNPTIATATIAGSTLRVIGANIGTTAVGVGDAETPQNTKIIAIVIESPVLFASQIQPIFSSSYGCAGCHSGGVSGGLNLDGTAASNYANLVNVTAQAGCTDKKRVLARSPLESVFYLRVSSFTCGDRMPKGGSPISTTHLDLIRKWISQGAKNN